MDNKSKIIFDINGVILNDVKLSVILHAMQEYGHAKALWLLVCYKLKFNKGVVNQHIIPIAEEQAPKAHFLPGAEKTVDKLTKLKKFDYDICSNSGVGGDVAEAEKLYRTKSSGMNRINHYELLPMDASKKEFYRKASKGYRITYVVDDSLRNIKAAYELDMEYRNDDTLNCKIERIFISKNANERKIAHERYGARCFETLVGFYNLARTRK